MSVNRGVTAGVTTVFIAKLSAVAALPGIRKQFDFLAAAGDSPSPCSRSLQAEAAKAEAGSGRRCSGFPPSVSVQSWPTA